MPTKFIAVQCFQCSTMQVKQETKSSNKWSCVVCGEKQSMRQAFAQGFAAKDVRGFVQKFNMSRKFQEDKTFSDSPEETCHEGENLRKRRTDWTEYVDNENDECLGKLDVENGDSELEAIIVTEIPKDFFKKPKLKPGSKFANTFGSYSNGFQELATSGGGSIKSGRAVKKQEVCSEEEQSDSHHADRAFKWDALRSKIHKGDNDWTSQSKDIARGSKWDVYSTGDEKEAPSRLFHRATAPKGPASKWSCFVTEDDYDEVTIREKGGSSDRPNYTNSDGLESLVNDEKVEDDIHPDFL